MRKTIIAILIIFVVFGICLTSCSSPDMQLIQPSKDEAADTPDEQINSPQNDDKDVAGEQANPPQDNIENIPSQPDDPPNDDLIDIDDEMPPSVAYFNCDGWNELFAFLESAPKIQLQILQERKLPMEKIEKILLFANKIKNYSLPFFDRGKDVEYIELVCYPGLEDRIAIYWDDAAYFIDYPSEKIDANIQMGNINSYYQNVHPGYARPDSYDKLVYKTVEFIELDRNDIEADAILTVPQHSAPNIAVVFDDVILTFSVFGKGMGPTELIEMVNTAVIENGWEQHLPSNDNS